MAPFTLSVRDQNVAMVNAIVEQNVILFSTEYDQLTFNIVRELHKIERGETTNLQNLLIGLTWKIDSHKRRIQELPKLGLDFRISSSRLTNLTDQLRDLEYSRGRVEEAMFVETMKILSLNENK